MTELEITEHYIEVLYICAYVGFALWGIAGWYVGRYFLRTRYIKPNGLINMKYVRLVQDENLRFNGLIKQIQQEKKLLVEISDKLEQQNKSLWAWSYNPHRDAYSITIKQVDKNGEDVAWSDITLPDRKHWVEPVCYADDEAQAFQEWRDTLPHNQKQES